MVLLHSFVLIIQYLRKKQMTQQENYQALMKDINERSALPLQPIRNPLGLTRYRVSPEMDDLLGEVARDVASLHFDVHAKRLDCVDRDDILKVLQSKLGELIHGS